MIGRLLLAALGCAGALAVAGCGGSDSTSAGAGGSATTLRVPFLADMSVPDPDVFYDIEGNSVILSVYEGLLKYAPDSTEIVPSLAESYTVSKDQLVYTFALRRGVTFHDGSPLTAKAVKAALERRVDVGSAPAYMLEQVARIDTPDAHTVVIRLERKVGPFLAYLASSWGPKIIGPEAIEQHKGKDFGQSWLETHGDGTGPYVLGEFSRGRQYVLTRNQRYWGEKPSFGRVVLKITPDIGTQRLELQRGDLDAILHSFPASELDAVKGDESLRVREEDSFLRAMLYLNTHTAPFSDPAARAALARAIDVRKVVTEAYGSTASVPTGPYPPGILASESRLDYGEQPPVAKPGSGSGELLLAYTADESGVQRRVAEMLQAQISALGYEIKLKEVQLPQVYEFVNDLERAPDLLLMTNTPDAAHPDTWARIVWHSKGGLNFLGYSDPKLDALLERAQSLEGERADALYREVGERFVAAHELVFLADVKDTMVVRKDLAGGGHVPAYPWMLDYASLRRG